MPNGNPFYVDPTGGIDLGQRYGQLGQSLAGLGQVMGQRREAEAQQARQSDMINEINSAVSSGNLDLVADVMGKYPDMQGQMRQNLVQAMNIKDKAGEDRLKKDTFDILNNPKQAQQILTKRIAEGEAAGRDMSETKEELESWKADPKSTLQQTEAFAATSFPEYKDWASVMREKKAEKKPLQAGKDALVFDPNTGTYSVDPVASEYLQTKAAEKAAEGAVLGAKDRQGINKDVTGLLKNSVEINSAAKDLVKLKLTSSPTDQLAAVFKFMKALDPTSVVRKEEQDAPVATGGPADALIGFANRIIGEGALPPEAFQNMVNTAVNLSNSASDSTNESISSYLDAYEGTIPESFKGKLKARVPGRIEIEAAKTPTSEETSVFRAPPQPVSAEQTARMAQTGTQPAPQPGQFTSTGGVQFTVRGQ